MDRETADILQEAKTKKAKVAETMLRQKPGIMRWFLKIPYKLFNWVEKQARKSLND